jgi:uncharacterized protein (TIGR00730 family)
VTRETIITVFGSSRPHQGDADYEEARTLGRSLGHAGVTVCSGGYGGVMEAVSRGTKESGGVTIAVTAAFFAATVNRWVDKEIRVKTWEERLFELIRLADGYVACRGGTGTLVELSVVWEMMNKRVMPGKPFVVLGEFWQPILERVREVELGPHPSEAWKWGEADARLIHCVATAEEAKEYLTAQLR